VPLQRMHVVRPDISEAVGLGVVSVRTVENPSWKGTAGTGVFLVVQTSPAVAILRTSRRTVRQRVAAAGSRQEQQGDAAELSIAEATVKTHVSNILSKLGVQDRTQAAVFALRRGMFPDPQASR